MNIGWVILIVITTVLSTLKLTGQIAMSWLWILAPIWIPIGIGVLISLAILTWFLNSEEYKNYKIRKKQK